MRAHTPQPPANLIQILESDSPAKLKVRSSTDQHPALLTIHGPSTNGAILVGKIGADGLITGKRAEVSFCDVALDIGLKL